MSKNTTYYSLVKPEDTERYDVNVMNANLDTIDANLKTTNDKFASYLPLNANATSATKATQDGNGNNIVNTYARKDYIPPICIGSQIIYTGKGGSGAVAKTALLGAYGTTLIDGVGGNVTVPSGWHKEYKITFQVTTGGDCQVHIWLNSHDMCSGGTWSSNTFRTIPSSSLMKASAIGQETTLGYGNPGINLYYSVVGNTSWEFWNVTVHCYLVRD